MLHQSDKLPDTWEISLNCLLWNLCVFVNCLGWVRKKFAWFCMLNELLQNRHNFWNCICELSTPNSAGSFACHLSHVQKMFALDNETSNSHRIWKRINRRPIVDIVNCTVVWVICTCKYISGDATMDFHSGEPRAHIRAPSLKRGKNDCGLNERVSFTFYFFISFHVKSSYFYSSSLLFFLRDISRSIFLIKCLCMI